MEISRALNPKISATMILEAGPASPTKAGPFR